MTFLAESTAIHAERPPSMARVRIHDVTGRGDLARRVSVASGLCFARELPNDGGEFAFLDDALAPIGPWRSATPEELRGLSQSEGGPADTDLALIALPRIAAETAEQLERCAGDLEASLDAVKRAEFTRALHAAVEELVPFCARPDDLVFQGVCVRRGGERLVTPNLTLVPHRRIGLHVDNWDGRLLLERGSGRRRLCANIGARPRYFLFLKLTLCALVAGRRVPSAVPPGRSPAFLVRRYLAAHMRQTVFRVRIDPGEAYIVNAEDIIHDASTEGSDAPDITLQFLGHFWARPEAVGP